MNLLHAGQVTDSFLETVRIPLTTCNLQAVRAQSYRA